MGLSGTRTFTMTRNQICTDALRIINALELGGTATGDQIVETSRVLNRMVKAWQSKGVFLWTEQRVKIDLVSGTATYSLDSDYLDIRDAYLRQSDGTDLQINIVSQTQYDQEVDKDTAGLPMYLVFNRTLSPTVTLYPVPDDSTLDLYLLGEKKLQDFNDPSDNPDFPVNWLDALVYGLAARLADNYQKPIQERAYLTQKAAGLFLTAKTKSQGEREDDSFVEPAY